MKNFFRKIIIPVAAVAMTACVAVGVAGCKPKAKNLLVPDDKQNIRKELPATAVDPTTVDYLDALGYLQTKLDQAENYQSYAYNTSEVMSYTQRTRSWKTYLGEESSGVAGGVMVCSDLTYSSLVKASTQSLFINNEVYMRGGSKPGKNSAPTDINWDEGEPEYYDRETYLHTYGEFSTALSVYLLNGSTIESGTAITSTSEGNYTFEVTFRNGGEFAVYYYQYGMQRRGDLKVLPKFKSLKMSFTFDSQWRILSTYAEEKTKLAPSALGGMESSGKGKTTTYFFYDQTTFDDTAGGYVTDTAAHNAYYTDYFAAHLKTN